MMNSNKLEKETSKEKRVMQMGSGYGLLSYGKISSYRRITG